MKYTITKETFDALDEAGKAHYTLSGDSATLVIEDGPDYAKLKNKLAIEKEHRMKAETRLTESTTRAEQLKADLDKAGDSPKKLEELRENFEKQLSEEKGKLDAERQTIVAARHKNLVNELASGFANDKFTVPELVTDRIAARLHVETVEGSEVVRVLDASGKPSILTVDDLKTEFLGNESFASIIKAPAGSGGNAAQSRGGTPATKKLSEMSVAEQSTMERENPEQFRELIAAE